jgi:hypothetical protein
MCETEKLRIYLQPNSCVYKFKDKCDETFFKQ